MPICNPAELRAQIAPGQRILGFDVGAKTIGLALADATLAIASPLEILRRTKFTKDAERIKALIDEHNVGGLVIGLPVNMNGSEGPRCQSVRQFAANLLGKFDIAVAFWDERLSTAAVERMMVEEIDLSRKRRGELVDKLAAAWILQGALDAMDATGGAP